jgi:hypothetical protein
MSESLSLSFSSSCWTRGAVKCDLDGCRTDRRTQPDEAAVVSLPRMDWISAAVKKRGAGTFFCGASMSQCATAMGGAFGFVGDFDSDRLGFRGGDEMGAKENTVVDRFLRASLTFSEIDMGIGSSCTHGPAEDVPTDEEARSTAALTLRRCTTRGGAPNLWTAHCTSSSSSVSESASHRGIPAAATQSISFVDSALTECKASFGASTPVHAVSSIRYRSLRWVSSEGASAGIAAGLSTKESSCGFAWSFGGLVAGVRGSDRSPPECEAEEEESPSSAMSQRWEVLSGGRGFVPRAIWCGESPMDAAECVSQRRVNPKASSRRPETHGSRATRRGILRFGTVVDLPGRLSRHLLVLFVYEFGLGLTTRLSLV